MFVPLRYSIFNFIPKRPKNPYRYVSIYKRHVLLTLYRNALCRNVVHPNSITLSKKHGNMQFWNSVEHEPVPTRVLNVKESGASGRSPWWGMQGGEAPAKKNQKNFEHFFTQFFSFLKV